MKRITILTILMLLVAFTAQAQVKNVTKTYAEGDKYVGEWKNGKKNGQGTKTSAEGYKYVGEFKDGFCNGQGTMTWADGRVEKGIWKDDKLVERQ